VRQVPSVRRDWRARIGGWRTRADSWRGSAGNFRDWTSNASVLRFGARAAWLIDRLIFRWSLRIALPLLSVAVVLRSFPYQATVQGVSFRVGGTIFTRPGLSADTTLGNWEFPAVDGLPFGVHISPQDVDIVALAQAANSDVAGYAQRLQMDMKERLPDVIIWLAAETVLGLLLGLAMSAALNMAVRYLRGLPRRPDELRHRARQLGAAGLVTVAVAGYGAVTFNHNWVRESRLTGSLAAARLFPDQLNAFYERSKAQDVLGSVVGIQGALQEQIEQATTPDTALRIMFISDVHLAAVYPLVAQYAANYDVNLMINTGDEAEFATKAELTPAYIQAITTLTRKTPMLWLAGNHDSPEVQGVMAKIPGVTVLGDKVQSADGYTVSAGMVQAFGLRIAGLPDPRVYGGPGVYGADATNVTDPLERSAVDTALAGIKGLRLKFDIFATHEPVAAAELRKVLPGRIRQTNSGHVHAQNATGDIQSDAGINLIEGSTGAGGLDNIVRALAAPPIEFSIESVAASCQFTRVLRFQIRSPQVVDETTPQAYGDDVTLSTEYFRPQQIEADRSCGIGVGATAVTPQQPL
jgi:Calcineurin-like phosphoesterase